MLIRHMKPLLINTKGLIRHMKPLLRLAHIKPVHRRRPPHHTTRQTAAREATRKGTQESAAQGCGACGYVGHPCLAGLLCTVMAQRTWTRFSLRYPI